MFEAVIPVVVMLAGKAFDAVLGKRRAERDLSDQEDVTRLKRMLTQTYNLTEDSRNPDLIEDIRELGERIYERGGETAMQRVTRLAFPFDGSLEHSEPTACIDRTWHAIGTGDPRSWRKGTWVS